MILRPTESSSSGSALIEREALTKSPLPEGALEEIYDRAPLGIALFDTSCRYLRVNPFLEVLDRASEDAHLGRTPVEILPQSGAAITKALEDVIRTGERRAISLAPERDRYWAAEFYPILDDAKVIVGVGALIRDLTAVVHAERVLRDHAAFEKLVSRISARLARTPAHDVDGQIESAIQEAAGFLRIERGELLKIGPRNLEGRGVGPELKYRLVPVGDIPWFMEAMREGRTLAVADTSTLPPMGPAERDILSVSGVKSFLALPLTVGGDLIGVALFSASDRPRGWPPEVVERLNLLAQVLANVLARRRADDELRRQRDELLHLWRIGTVNQVTATIAHEIRQPLTAIIANAAAGARFLSMTAPPLGEVRDALTEIQGDAQRAAGVVARARETLARSEPRSVVFDLPRLVEETVRLARPSCALLGAQLTHRTDGPVPPVAGDPAEIQQVFLNLISNAAESVAGMGAPPREVEVLCAAENRWAVVTVSDTGAGLPEGLLEGIFEPFFTTKERGLGLGLPLCQTIVERHGGTITAANRAPRGAEFRVTLPPGEEVS